MSGQRKGRVGSNVRGLSPPRWSLFFIFAFLCWSSQIQRNVVLCYASNVRGQRKGRVRSNVRGLSPPRWWIDGEYSPPTPPSPLYLPGYHPNTHSTTKKQEKNVKKHALPQMALHTFFHHRAVLLEISILNLTTNLSFQQKTLKLTINPMKFTTKLPNPTTKTTKAYNSAGLVVVVQGCRK